jgi:hypothetical protein
MDSFELKGLWWLPDSPEDSIAGDLAYDGEHFPTLSLTGSWDELAQAINELPTYPVVHGVAGKHRITLVDCTVAGTRVEIPGTVYTSVRCDVALIGEHLDPDGLLFEELHVRYDILDEWSWITGFTTEYELDQSSGGIARLSLHYAKPAPIEADCDEVVVAIEAEWTKGGRLVFEHEIKQSLFLRIIPNTPLSLETLYLKYARRLQDFLIVTSGYPTSTVTLRGIPRSIDAISGSGSPGRMPPVEVALPIPKGTVRPDHCRPEGMPLPLAVIGDDLSIALRRWFALDDEFSPILNLYFSAMLHPSPFVEQQFLTLTQTLEAYHRRQIGGQYLEDEAFQSLRGSLTSTVREANVLPDAQDAFANKIRYMNELSFRTRLRELCELLGNSTTALYPDRQLFIQRVVDTRNYLTHYDEDLAERTADVFGMACLADTMNAMMQACLLTELGHSGETLIEIVSRSHLYRKAKQQAANYWRA